MADLFRTIARWRVALGFGAAAVALLLADPNWDAWRAGVAVAAAGEAIRIWAAGHLEKSREITRSGPYRWTRHPLYAGSCVIALGVVIASRSAIVAAVAAAYMSVTIAAAIRTEEAFLRQKFGEAYDQYAGSRGGPMVRRFSVARALRNREHRAIAGLISGFALLALKILAPL